MKKKKRDMYNMGGISAHKSVGDLDLSLSASGTDDYQRVGAGATYQGKGFKVRGETSTDKFGNRGHSVGVTKNINDKLSFGFEKRKGYVGVTGEYKF
jgi:hypothetical protein